MFVFVFYFQGVKGDDPVLAGVKLAPLAVGMLVASPLAGIWADRHGSRMLAALGMVVSAVALAGMTLLGVDSPYWQAMLWLALVGVGLRHVQLAEHGGDDGHGAGAPARDRRGGADDAAEHGRRAVDRVRAWRSSPRPCRRTCCCRSSPGLASSLSVAQLDPFVHNMHTALWVLAATSLVGAAVSLMRPPHVAAEPARRLEAA